MACSTSARGGPGSPVNGLGPQGCEEGLRDGVVRAGARPPDRAGDAGQVGAGPWCSSCARCQAKCPVYGQPWSREGSCTVSAGQLGGGTPGSHFRRSLCLDLVRFTPTRSGKPAEYQSARTHRSVHPHPHPVRLWPARWAVHASRQNCRSMSGSDWERFHERPSGVEVPTLHQVFHPTLYRLFRYNSLQDAVS